MAIRFPKMHIATSVVNRILNAHDDIEESTNAPTPPQAPSTPEVPQSGTEGAEIEARLSTPLAPVAPNADAAVGSIEGQGAMTGMLDGLTQ